MCGCIFAYKNKHKTSSGERNGGTASELLSNVSEPVADNLLFMSRNLEIILFVAIAP